MVHRGELHAALVASISPELLHLGAACAGLEQDAEGVSLHLSDGRVERGAIAVGADGLRSKVREVLFGEEAPRYSGETCFRGIADFELPEDEQVYLREVQGRGLRCCVAPLGPGRVYWWATERRPAGEMVAPEAINRSTPSWALERAMRQQFGYDAGPLELA